MTSGFELSVNTKESVRQIRAGHRWLIEQHRLWLAGDPLDGDDTKFSHILGDWGLLEQVLRRTGFIGCIWAPGGLCPADAPVICDDCTESAQSKVVVQLGLEGIAPSTQANSV